MSADPASLESACTAIRVSVSDVAWNLELSESTVILYVSKSQFLYRLDASSSDILVPKKFEVSWILRAPDDLSDVVSHCWSDCFFGVVLHSGDQSRVWVIDSQAGSVAASIELPFRSMIVTMRGCVLVAANFPHLAILEWNVNRSTAEVPPNFQVLSASSSSNSCYPGQMVATASFHEKELLAVTKLFLAPSFRHLLAASSSHVLLLDLASSSVSAVAAPENFSMDSMTESGCSHVLVTFSSRTGHAQSQRLVFTPSLSWSETDVSSIVDLFDSSAGLEAFLFEFWSSSACWDLRSVSSLLAEHWHAKRNDLITMGDESDASIIRKVQMVDATASLIAIFEVFNVEVSTVISEEVSSSLFLKLLILSQLPHFKFQDRSADFFHKLIRGCLSVSSGNSLLNIVIMFHLCNAQIVKQADLLEYAFKLRIPAYDIAFADSLLTLTVFSEQESGVQFCARAIHSIQHHPFGSAFLEKLVSQSGFSRQSLGLLPYHFLIQLTSKMEDHGMVELDLSMHSFSKFCTVQDIKYLARKCVSPSIVQQVACLPFSADQMLLFARHLRTANPGLVCLFLFLRREFELCLACLQKLKCPQVPEAVLDAYQRVYPVAESQAAALILDGVPDVDPPSLRADNDVIMNAVPFMFTDSSYQSPHGSAILDASGRSRLSVPQDSGSRASSENRVQKSPAFASSVIRQNSTPAQSIGGSPVVPTHLFDESTAMSPSRASFGASYRSPVHVSPVCASGPVPSASRSQSTRKSTWFDRMSSSSHGALSRLASPPGVLAPPKHVSSAVRVLSPSPAKSSPALSLSPLSPQAALPRGSSNVQALTKISPMRHPQNSGFNAGSPDLDLMSPGNVSSRAGQTPGPPRYMTRLQSRRINH